MKRLFSATVQIYDNADETVSWSVIREDNDVVLPVAYGEANSWDAAAELAAEEIREIFKES